MIVRTKTTIAIIREIQTPTAAIAGIAVIIHETTVKIIIIQKNFGAHVNLH